VPDDDAAREIAFLQYYLDQTWDEMRHIETQRASFVGSISSLTLVALGFVGQQGFKRKTLPVSIGVVVLGLFGVLAVAKFTSMHARDQARVDAWHRQWETLIHSTVLATRDSVDDATTRSSHASRIRHRHLWYSMCLACSLAGAAVAIATVISG
jgi:hypothetical protein